jgi:hypothetical protein
VPSEVDWKDYVCEPRYRDFIKDLVNESIALAQELTNIVKFNGIISRFTYEWECVAILIAIGVHDFLISWHVCIDMQVIRENLITTEPYAYRLR